MTGSSISSALSIPASSRLSSIADAAQRRIQGNELRIPCPAHQGENDNLVLWIDRYGNPNRISAYCHSRGCSYVEIADAIRARFGVDLQPLEPSRFEVARWDYQNLRGETVHVVRWSGKLEQGVDKCTRDPKGIRGPFLVRLFANDRTAASGPVIVTEGEKAAEAVAEAGYVAASYIGGAKSARRAVYSPLQDRDVIIWADDDHEGRKAAADVARALNGVASSIKAVAMPGGESKRDAADYPIQERRSMIEAAESWAPPIDTPPEEEREVLEKSAEGLLEALDILGYSVRWNTRSKRAEFQHGTGAWKPLTDRFTANLREMIASRFRYFNTAGHRVRFQLGKDTFEDYINALMYDREVDGFLADYLELLPSWDGVARVNTMLQDVFGVEDTLLTQAIDRLILMMAIKRTLSPGYKNDVIPVLRGEQGWGKSAFVRQLLPPGEVGDEWYGDSIDFYSDEKTRIEATDGKVIVEWAEMSSLHGPMLAKAKAYQTRNNDNSIRGAFARNAEARPRRFIIIATTDADSPLPDDPAGNRRYVLVELRHGADVESWFDQRGVSEIHPDATRRDMLWAEALARVRQGIRPDFPRSLLEEQTRVNDNYRPVDDMLETPLELLETEENRFGMKLAAIRNHILQTDPQSAVLQKAVSTDRRLNQAMLKRKWRRGTGRDRSTWYPPLADIFGE